MFIKPSEIINNISIPEYSNIVDFGFGSGFFLDYLVKKINRDVSIYAIDIQSKLIERKKKEFMERGIDNVFFMKKNLEEVRSTKILEDSIDFILISSILSQSKKKENILNEAKRILAPTGRVLIIESRDNFLNVNLSKIKLLEMLEKNFFFLEKEVNTGDYHYGLVIRKRK